MTDIVERLRKSLEPPVQFRPGYVAEAADEIERLQAALDDEMQAHCTCVEMRDEAILKADKLQMEVKWLRDLLRKESLKRLVPARRAPPGPSVE